MSRFARFGLTALALLAAPFLLVQGMANAHNPLSPAYGWNGFNLAQLSMGRLQVDETANGGFPMAVREGGAELARKAFAREPLAGDALFVLAIDQGAGANPEAVNAMLEGAYALDKRNRNIGALQLQQAALTGDITQTFGIIDRLATLYPALKSDFVAPLTLALSDPASLAPLQTALEGDPVWSEAFWLAVPRDAQRVSTMYALRQQIDNGTSAQSDAALLAELAKQELYGPAFDFWAQISDQQQNLLGFVMDDAFPPFGWELTASGERAMSKRGDTRFEAYVQNDTSGELARQLLHLQPGLYQFSASITPESQAANITVDLQCVTGETGVAASQPLNEAVRWYISSACETYWLVLSGSAWNSSNPLRVTIEDMQFQAGN